MKQLTLFVFALVFFHSCKKDDTAPYAEDLTKGSKWGISIGSTAAAVYTQLQALGQEKQFTEVEVVSQPTYDNPAAIGPRVVLYNGISFEEKDNVYPNRVIIQFFEEKVSSIMAGGSLPGLLTRWPQSAPDNRAILQNETLNTFYNKLQAVYASGVLEGYILRLGAKTLTTSYDQEMAGFERWHFTFTNGAGTSTVDLYFKAGRLNRLHHEYSELKMFDDN